MKKDKTLTIRVTADDFFAIRDAARVLDITPSQLVRIALAEYLRKANADTRNLEGKNGNVGGA